MKDEIVQALLVKVMNWTSADEDQLYRPHLQSMAKYKYDAYQQFYPGMRFIESLAKWLKQYKTKEDRETALNFIKEKLIFISNHEINHLVMSAFPDMIKRMIMEKISKEENIPLHKISKIANGKSYQILKRQCLFLGLSDGSKTEIFRRSNTGELSHEQVYQTYELSKDRAGKMKKELREDLEGLLGKKPDDQESQYKMLFLLDDFSGSGKTYLRKDDTGQYKGKIASIYAELREPKSAYSTLMDIKSTEVRLILYLCSAQALKNIRDLIDEMWDSSYPKPKVYAIHQINDAEVLDENRDHGILALCLDDDYYDSDLQDKHTAEGGGDVKFGFGKCKLPLVLEHNTPNNSISLLWAYDEEKIKFKGLFPRIPRHKEPI
jgi:hypothetical protein